MEDDMNSTAAQEQQPEPVQQRLLRIRDVLELVRMSRAKLYDLIAHGDFPRPVKIGRMACWPASTVNAWILAKMAAADRDAANNEGQRVHEAPAK
jgi:prophage regulatory protein